MTAAEFNSQVLNDINLSDSKPFHYTQSGIDTTKLKNGVITIKLSPSEYNSIDKYKQLPHMKKTYNKDELWYITKPGYGLDHINITPKRWNDGYECDLEYSGMKPTKKGNKCSQNQALFDSDITLATHSNTLVFVVVKHKYNNRNLVKILGFYQVTRCRDYTTRNSFGDKDETDYPYRFYLKRVST